MQLGTRLLENIFIEKYDLTENYKFEMFVLFLFRKWVRLNPQ